MQNRFLVEPRRRSKVMVIYIYETIAGGDRQMEGSSVPTSHHSSAPSCTFSA